MQELVYCSLYICVFQLQWKATLFKKKEKKQETRSTRQLNEKRLRYSLRGEYLNARTLFPTLLVAQDGSLSWTFQTRQ
jgi:hypothetical protein